MRPAKIEIRGTGVGDVVDVVVVRWEGQFLMVHVQFGGCWWWWLGEGGRCLHLQATYDAIGKGEGGY